LPFCSICRFEYVDASTAACPNCGAPVEIKTADNDLVEQASPKDITVPGRPRPVSPSDEKDQDNLEICDPGELLDPDKNQVDSQDQDNLIGHSTPHLPMDDDTGDKPSSAGTGSNGQAKIQKLSEEQIHKIRSRMLAGDSEYVSPQDASSILHNLAKSGPGSRLERQASKNAPSPAENGVPHAPNPPTTPSSKNDMTNEEQAPVQAVKTAPMRKIAYFHKNFIQLTGNIFPASGEELLIEDRYYLLKPKKIKSQHAIVLFSVLALVLLFIVGKQFISPTLPGNGAIVGVILDDNRQPLINGIELSLPEAGRKTVSDAIGFFRFEGVPTGTYVVRYSLPDGRIGSENISVAGEKITTISLTTADASNESSAARAQTGTASQSPLPASNSYVPGSLSGASGAASTPELTTGQIGAKKDLSALKLAANVDGAKLTVNGDVLGAGNNTYKKLLPGSHTITVSKDGYKAWKGTVDLEANETYTLSVTLEKKTTDAESPAYGANDFYQSGQTMLTQGNTEAAIKDLSQAVTLDPSMADAYLARAQAYHTAGRTVLAETDYVRAGEIYRSQKRLPAAMDAFTKALEVNDKSVPALINRGDVYQLQDNNSLALNDFQRAAKIDNSNFRASFEMGKVYFSMGQHKDADKRLRKAQELNPGVPEVYHYLMLNYLARDDFNKVKQAYGEFKSNVSEDDQDAFKSNPRFDAVLRVIGEYERP